MKVRAEASIFIWFRQSKMSHSRRKSNYTLKEPREEGNSDSEKKCIVIGKPGEKFSDRRTSELCELQRKTEK